MKVKILRPVSKGKRGSIEFFEIGKTIDFQKDIQWPDGVNVKEQAMTMQQLGYIEILKEEIPEKLAVEPNVELMTVKSTPGIQRKKR